MESGWNGGRGRAKCSYWIVGFVEVELSPLPFCSQRPLKGHESCMGTVVSEYFVLTAAHCFTVDDQEHSIKVSVGKEAANQSRASAVQEPTLPVLTAAPSLARWATWGWGRVGVRRDMGPEAGRCPQRSGMP